MKTEHGNAEGHSAVLKLHRGAYMSRTRLPGTGNRIEHTHAHHRVTKPLVRVPSNKDMIVSTKTCRSRRGSSISTTISYPGLSTDDDIDEVEAIDETPEVTPSVMNIVDHEKARPLSSKYKITSHRVPINSDKEKDFNNQDEHREESAVKDATRDLQVEAYNRMCKMEGTTPCSRFRRQMNDCVADMSNGLLGLKDIKSICVSLTSNVTIKELNLSGNNLSEKGAKYVAEALRENTSIEDLTLSQCNIDLEGLQAISNVLLDMKPMKILDMSNNHFERRHAEVLAEVIKKNDYIEDLNLSGNQFDDVGGMTIGKALVHNVGIKKLDLSWNHLRRDGARTVCLALKSNTTLEELDLSWNGLAEEGARALGSALPYNHTLKELDITCNRISAFCLPDFLKGLAKNDTLKVLRISQNPLTTEGAIATMKFLTKSDASQLVDLYMTDIPINPDFLDELDELLKKRAVKVYHRDPNKKKITPIIRQRTLKDYDPAMILFEYMKQENLRLIDLFRTFDTDSSQSVSKEELKEGFVTINMPLTEDALESLFHRLDLNDNDEIEYEEVKCGYRKTMAKLRSSDDPNEEQRQAAIKGLKKLVSDALKKKRDIMRENAAKRVADRHYMNDTEYKIAYRKSMKKMKAGLASDNENDVHAMTQLKSLVKRALEDRRQEKLLQLKGKRRQRQASLTAVFQFSAGQLIKNKLETHHE
ncbi:hypothetical protein ACF0H5_010301 [Mactra antiquata]